MMNQKILQLTDVRKEYGKNVGVDTVSLDLAQGEFVTFLGASGSGKTTTLSMIAGLIRPTSGFILLNGNPLDPLPPYERNIGMVFQHYALFPHMTVAKNIAFPLEMRRLTKAEIHSKVNAVLKMMDLGDYGERYPRQLSGGQQQRIALARAIVFEPPLLLMDEPLGALDKKLREQMQLEIMHMHKELGMSIVYVTHDQQEALIMSDRVAVFKEGRIEQIGSPQLLYERPENAFVANFVGESNLFPGIVQSVEGEHCVIDSQVCRMRAFNTVGLAKGDRATVAVRPERMRVTAKTDGVTENRVAGRVKEAIYLGESRKYVIALDGGSCITVLQNAHEADSHSLTQDEEVCMTWDPDDGNTLEDSQS